MQKRASFEMSTGQMSSKVENFSCQLCFKEFSGERPPLILCKNEHNCCRDCVNNFYKNATKSCPFCSSDFKLVYNEDFLLRIESSTGVFNKEIQQKTKPKANRNNKQETYWRAKKAQYMSVLALLENANKNPIE